MLITIIYPLYNAKDNARSLIEDFLKQKHPKFENQSDWLTGIFLDDCSTDDTFEAFKKEIERQWNPKNLKIVKNETNLGLSANLNQGFKSSDTAFVLSHHQDVLFGSDDYVYQMLSLIEQDPKTAVVTGCPSINPDNPLNFSEKVNLVTNLMDLFPPEDQGDLISVGFAEGRCDIFRKSAIEEAGYYDLKLKVSGEDQVLANKLRELGYKLLQSPKTKYYLSVSSEQNSILKLIKHQRKFGRTTPYILLNQRGAYKGIMGELAGHNRNLRMLLRLSQIMCVGLYIGFVLSLFSGIGLLPILFTWILIKAAIFWKHILYVELDPKEITHFLLLQPLFDISFTYSLVHGFLLFFKSKQVSRIG